MQNYSYSVIGAIAIVIHLIVNYPALVGKYERAGMCGARAYRGFLLGVLAFYVTDVLWGFFAGLVWTRILFLDTVVYFIVLALATLYWCRFAVDYLERKSSPGRVLIWTGKLFLVLTFAMLAVNPWTRWVFWFDSEGGYHASWFRYFAFAAQIGLFAFCTALSAQQALRATVGTRLRHMAVALFGLTMVTSVAAQFAYPLLPFYSLGCLVGICFLNIFVMDSDRDAIRARQAQLEAERDADRRMNEARSYFFSTVSHDIRTPLNAIIGYLDLVKAGIDDPLERAKAIDTAISSGKVLMALVNNVLDLSKLEYGKMSVEPVDVNMRELVDRTVSSFRLACEQKGLLLEADVAAMPVLRIDPYRVGQILFNLLGNAVKFTDTGSVIVRAEYADGTLRISVIDTGCGIAESDMGRLMTPYTQVAGGGRHGGTGLGLAICKQLAELMGGTFAVTSEITKGSTFMVTLPSVPTGEALSSNAPAAAPAVRPTASVPTTGLRVLLVDDSPVNISVGRALLRRCGVTRITTAENGRRGLEAFREMLNEGVDGLLVITDLWMPEMNGEELAQAIRKIPEAKGVRVLALTADVEAQKLPATAGFDRILLKPLTLECIQNVVAEFHDGTDSPSGSEEGAL